MEEMGLEVGDAEQVVDDTTLDMDQVETVAQSYEKLNCYSVLLGGDEGKTFEVIVIGYDNVDTWEDCRYYLALPKSAYPQRLSDRMIKRESVEKGSVGLKIKGFMVEIGDVLGGMATNEGEPCFCYVSLVRVTWPVMKTLRLNPDGERGNLKFESVEEEDGFPLGAALIEAAAQKLGYVTFDTAESGSDEARSQTQVEEKVSALEKQIKALTATLTAIAPSQSSGLQPKAAPLRPSTVARPALQQLPIANDVDRAASGPHVDQSVLAEAEAAGIPRSEVMKVASLLQHSGKGVSLERKPARRPAARPTTVLGESDEEVVDVDTPGTVMERTLLAVANSLNTMQRAMVNQRDPLDRALEGSQPGQGDHLGGLSGRRGATAYTLLARALVEDPERISTTILKNMKEANRVTLNADDESMPDPLYWLEHRSRVLGHARTNVQYAWIIGHIAKALIEGKEKEALSRALLGLVAADTVSMDRGSWLTAWELQFMKEPPFSAFDNHSVETSRLPYSELIDPRWNEVVLARLRDIDETTERRLRLQDPGQAARGNGKGQGKNGDGKGKDKTKGKKKEE